MIAVGVDVSKSKSMVAILSSDGEIVAEPFEVYHVNDSLDNLITNLLSLNDDIKIVMEATGHYHLPILKKFLEANLFVSVMNPYLMKKYGDNQIRKAKTDRKDAMRMATYALEKAYTLIPYTSLEQKYLDLKFLSRQYNQRISTKVKNRVYLGNLLDETMPGIENILMAKTTKPENNMLYNFINKYQSFDTIKKMGEKKFLNSYTKLAEKNGCRNYQMKALKIYELATNSITTRGTDTYTNIAIQQCLNVLIQAEIAANEILVQMQSLAQTLPEYPIVRGMCGVGDRLTPRLIAEIGDVRRFTSGKALNAFAGNDAPPFQSGQFESQNRHISKRGAPSLRKACYEVMQCLKMHKPQDDPVYLFMIKKEEEGKPLNVAKMAAINKFLRIYYARVMELYK
ncbi:Transposase IS116/IS110/IS902 family protein [Anaerosporobacter mobilis DSM 15930]|jgi:transposase|uniref:Transposase IS116/IS110/IS902 family protein n=3 Tax=Anaerosporobacter mobilis DSM 15930 TaxID=1120996 RepID=A0A1M7NQX4_9FIRM|nr:IS110 family transposase [Anaerosporobacter mobilis]SHN05998.1 Transposase IS116/IS110/IS902 family protein [Anaerosporobacter mobilis DSM 15930]